MTYEELQLHHAVFQQIAPSLYRVEKDILTIFPLEVKYLHKC